MLTFLLITGCTTTPTEETPQGPSVLSESNTMDSVSASEEKNQSSDIESDFSETTQPSINSEEVSMQSDTSSVISFQETSNSVTTSSNTEDERDKGLPPITSYFKSVDEMLDWIQNDDFANCTFKQTVRQLKLEQLLTILPADDTFLLDRIEIRHKDKYIMYYFTNEKNEQIYYGVLLPTENRAENYLEVDIIDTNQKNQMKYKTFPEIRAAKEVSILGKSRKTYIRNYAQEAIVRETGETKPIYTMFFTDVDGFEVRGGLLGSCATKNWDNKYLNYFEFSMHSINK